MGCVELADCDESLIEGPSNADYVPTDTIEAFCGATFVTALYEILESEQYDADLFSEVLEDGIPMVLWDNHVPEDYVLWLKDEGNDYQDGWGFSWVEMLDKCDEVNGRWDVDKDAYALQAAATCDSGGTRDAKTDAKLTPFRLHKQWFEEKFKKEFGNFTSYCHVRDFLSHMRKAPAPNCMLICFFLFFFF